MSQDKKVKVSLNQLEKLMQVLGLTSKVELAQVCRTTPSGVGWYFSKQEIPVTRLKLLALHFEEKVVRKQMDYTKDQVWAREFLEQKTGMVWKPLIADAEKVLASMKELRQRVSKGILDARGAATGLGNSNLSSQQNLEAASLESLIDEIQRRGWQISLSRKSIEG